MFDRIEPTFDSPPSDDYLEFRFGLLPDGRTRVTFHRDDEEGQVYYRATHPLSAYQMVLQGIRILAESDPERPVLVVDGSGGYQHFLAQSPLSKAPRAIQGVPDHYTDDLMP